MQAETVFLNAEAPASLLCGPSMVHQAQRVPRGEQGPIPVTQALLRAAGQGLPNEPRA